MIHYLSVILKIYFQSFVYDREMLILVPDDRLGGTWNQDMEIAEWTGQRVSVKEHPRDLIRFNGTIRTVSEYVVSIGLERRPLHMIISIIFPLVLLVSLSWCVFWLDEESVTNRVNISFIGILSVVVSIVVDKHNRAGRKVAGHKVDCFSRWAFPSFYIAISVLLGVIFFFLSKA